MLHWRIGCAAAGTAVLVSTVLPWSAAGAAGRGGWDSVSLALAVDEAVHEPVLRAFAVGWFAVPLLGASALLLAALTSLRWAAQALRVTGALLLLVLALLVTGLLAVDWELSIVGPLLAAAGSAALLLLPTRSRVTSSDPLPGSTPTSGAPRP
jgi:hypothetical protein